MALSALVRGALGEPTRSGGGGARKLSALQRGLLRAWPGWLAGRHQQQGSRSSRLAVFYSIAPFLNLPDKQRPLRRIVRLPSADPLLPAPQLSNPHLVTMPDQRVTYRRRHSYRTKTNKILL